MAELIFLDLEWNTTFYRNKSGERVPFHELIEVAAMKVEQDTGAMLDSFHSYIHPKASRKLESRTYRLLPYEREELRALLADAPGFLDLGPSFLRWCGPCPVFVEWGNNDVEVLLANFAFHRLSFDEDWKCEYFDLQYMYQKLIEGSLGCQPSLEKAVTELGIETDLDFHSAWNDTYYTIMVYQAMLDPLGLQEPAGGRPAGMPDLRSDPVRRTVGAHHSHGTGAALQVPGTPEAVYGGDGGEGRQAVGRQGGYL